jgi:putative transposase
VDKMTTQDRTVQFPRRTPEQWTASVTDFLESGLSAPNFCKQQNISYASFSKWRQRLATKNLDQVRDNDQPASFIDVSAQVNESTHWNITLNLGNGVELILTQT